MSALVLPKSTETGLKPIHLFNASALLSVIIGSFLCSFMGGSSLLALREMVSQTRASLRTIKMHKAFLISLFCQISVHGLMLGFPIMIYITSVIFNFDGNGMLFFRMLRETKFLLHMGKRENVFRYQQKRNELKCFSCWIRGNCDGLFAWNNEYTCNDTSQ
uniref:7TM_GPCR_Srx domain-containing protein n=1 Tax=Caenorhabditis tropicalis TaxID=1561998 RepID=A0A1I7TFA8_9PELO